MCFDQGIEIAIVMTKGTNMLTNQTIERLNKDFRFFKDNGTYGQKAIVKIYDILDLYRRGVTIATKSRLFELWDAMPNFPNMAELKWVVSTDPYFNSFPKATKPGIIFVPSEELEEHLKDAKELVKQGNSIRIKK